MGVFDGYRVTSGFGWRTHPIRGGKEWHTGIDLVKAHKSPIKAFTSGEVIYAGMGKSGTGFGGYGNVVLIKDKNNRGQLYAHLHSVAVKKGQKISKGQTIGYQGSTGQSTCSHLHFEVRKKAEDHIPYGWRANRKDNCLAPEDYLKGFVEDTKARNKHIYFPPGKGNWKVYPLDKVPVAKNTKGEINPTKFGGLTYEILGEDEPHTYIIQTSDFGKVKVYGHPSTDAVIKEKKVTKPSGKSIVPYPGHLIKKGSKGKDVERIQRAVGVTPDGVYGTKTEAAVKAYQERHGLSADGVVGPKYKWGL
ncbi:peptidoglycan DD-metalloendopeptidase family protein [Salirhabdus sp. Marseille-P4669]|uniref:peptidoglycan DD-metalloendopeptidase family protein n=1 Tax=Salirhabdus sp. Marseille-P4669 TaxID=2042310 RepID=UPI000C7D2C2E|nr:peptidoglycan DD-metalloendopeptidase family protein [Salirhabdus sp. Marseille-P4669]